jgi:WD40 repeat protein
VTASRDGTVRVWRHPSQSNKWWINDWILAAEYTPDGRYLFGFTPNRTVVRFDGERLKDEFVGGLYYGQAVDMDPSPDGLRAVLIDELCNTPVQVAMTNATEAVELTELPDGAGCPTRISWNPDSGGLHDIVAGTTEGALVAWDADTGKVTATADLGEAGLEVQDVAFSGDGRRVVAATGTGVIGRIHVLSASDLSPLEEWSASDLSHLDVSVDGRYVGTSGNDRHLVQVWDVEDHEEPVQVLEQATGTLSRVTLSQDPEASRVAVTTSAGRIYVWDRESGRLLAVTTRHADAANQVAFDPRDIDEMVSAGDDGEMVGFTCELCSMDVEELVEEAKDRTVQVVSVTD